MDVLLRHGFQEVVELELGLFGRFDDDFPLTHGQIDDRSALQMRIAGDGLGNPQRQAVSPFLDRGVHGKLAEKGNELFLQ